MAKKSSTGGILLCELLTIVFITLKLIGEIDWSWWWVLGPLWIPVALLAAAFVIALLVGIIKSIFS